MTITIGERHKTTFDGPTKMTEWTPPYKSGLYAILTVISQSDRYRILYIGESGNLSERGFVQAHHAYGCWKGQADSESRLYISVYPMPNSTPEERQTLEKQLIEEYEPVCNKE